VTETYPRAAGTPADVALLRADWAHWAELGHQLSEADGDRPTRLPGWSVRVLYAHVARSVEVLADALAAPAAEPANVPDAAGYFRAFDGFREQAARSVDEAARKAATTAPAEWATRLAEHGPALLDRAAAAGRTAVNSPAGRIAMPDYLLTRLVESTVHLLDLRAAVPGPGPQPEALGRIADVLVGVCGPTAFVEAATGRTSTTGFPLLP
jgi:uncharacterized protein (TIGR03083 family)